MKRKASIVLSVLIMLFIVSGIMIKEPVATELGLDFTWNRNDTLDDMMQIISNKTSTDEVLLKWNFNQFGTYNLEYRLKDDTLTIVKCRLDVDKVVIDYGVFRESTGEALTQGLANQSYYEMDYEATIPELKAVTPSVNANGYIRYTIAKSSASRYSGWNFVINNINVKLYWNIQLNTMHFYTNGITDGLFVGFELKSPEGQTKTLNILKNLQGFKATPTHWTSVGGTNENLTMITLPQINPAYQNELPGSRPGIRLEFYQPKLYNPTTYAYEYVAGELNDVLATVEVEDIILGEYFDFSLFLSGTNQAAINPPNTDEDAGVNLSSDRHIQYNAATGKYTVEVVKDKSELINKENYLQWGRLGASTVYNVTMTLAQDADYDFTAYSLKSGFGYTYVEYQAKRASLEDAYLSIKPYANGDTGDTEYTVYYSKSFRTVFTEDDIWLTHYHSTGLMNTNIYIPIPFRQNSAAEYYQLGMNFAGKPLTSQTIEYKPILEVDVPPPTPRIAKLENVAVTPALEADNDTPEKVTFDMIWSAPTNEGENKLLDLLLSEGNLYYELYVNTVPQETLTTPYSIIKSFRVSMTVDGIRIFDARTGEALTVKNDSGFVNGYNSATGEFGVTGITIREDEQWAIPLLREETGGISYSFEGTEAYSFEYPGLNYLRMRAVYENDTNVITQSEKSVAVSISLDLTKFEVPIPSDIRHTPLIPVASGENVGIALTWYPIDLSTYEAYMIFPLNAVINSVEYELFISADRDKLELLSDKDIILDTDYEEASGVKTNDNIVLDETGLQQLREGKVVRANTTHPKDKFGIIEYQVEGLDVNTKYYIIARAKLDITSEEGNTVTRESKTSNLNIVVSPINPYDEPIDTNFPLSPMDFTVNFLPSGNTGVELKWSYPRELNLGEILEFQLLRFRDRAMPTELDSKTVAIEDAIEEIIAANLEEVAYRLYKDVTDIYILEEYDYTTDEWVVSAATFDVTNYTVKLEDTNLSPNSIYYYYLRVSSRNSIENTASKWFPVTITTPPIQAPQNMTVPMPAPYNYDSKHEIFVQFDVQMDNAAVLGVDYEVEIYIKGEADSDYTNTKYQTTFVEKEASPNTAYTRMLYKISGLKSGASYSIKARLIDKTRQPEINPNGEQIYPSSDYSSRIITRTDFDQEDFNKEQIYNMYIEYFDSRADELRNSTFFVINNNDSLYEVKYRGDLTAGQMQSVRNGTLQMTVGTVGTHIYYIPAQMLTEQNNNNATLNIENAMMKLGIRANTLTTATDEIKKLIEEIGQYDASYKDYAIKLTITKGKYNGKVNGETPESDMVDIQFAVVPLTEKEYIIDDLLLSDLELAYMRTRAELANRLQLEMTKGISEAQLASITREYVELLKTNIADLQRVRIATLYNMARPIQEIKKTMYLSLMFDTDSVALTAYCRNTASFMKVNMYQTPGIYSISADKLGSYVITKADNSAIDVYNKEINDMITKYGFTEYFLLNELQNTEYTPNKYQITGALAKLLGAEVGQDAFEYLKAKGIYPMSSLGKYSTMTKENALNIILQAYEIKKGIDLGNVNIRDKNAIKDLSQINAELQKYILCGEQLGLFETDDGYLYPANEIIIKELFSILLKLQ